MDKRSNEYSVGDIVEDRENIVPLDDEAAAINSLQTYLARQKKKFNLAQAGNQNKRLTFLKSTLNRIKKQLQNDSELYQEVDAVIAKIDEGFVLIKDNNDQETFGKNIASVAQSISAIEQKILYFFKAVLDELKNKIKKTSEELSQKSGLVLNLESTISTKNEKISELEESLNSSETQFKTLSQEFAQLQKQLETQRQENQDLTNELNGRIETIKTLEAQASVYLEERKKLEKQFEDQAELLSETEKNLQSKKDELAKNISDASALEISLDAVKKQYHDKRVRVDALEEEIQRLKDELEKANEGVSEEQIQELEKALKRAEAIAGSKTKEVETLRTDFDELLSFFKEKEEECEILKEDSLKKQAKIDKTSRSFDETNQHLAMARRGLDEANEKIGSLDNELKIKEKDLKQKEKEIISLKKKLKNQEKKAKGSFTAAVITGVVMLIALLVVLFLKW